jgi:hypothetical protein
MKIVNLIGPAVIAGAVRYPVEGPLTVSDAEAEQLKDSGRLDGAPEDLPSEGDEPEDDGLDALKAEVAGQRRGHRPRRCHQQGRDGRGDPYGPRGLNPTVPARRG